jgi:hypothetical protein
VSYLLSCGPGTAGRPYPTLAAAMTAAGHPSAANWHLAPGYPGKILAGRNPDRTGPAAWRWVIQARDVAHELVDTVCAGSCLARAWSRHDVAVIGHAFPVLREAAAALATRYAVQAAVRLAGHYAAAGELARTRITAAVLAAYDQCCSDCGPDLAEAITGQVTAALRGAGVIVYDDRTADDSLRELGEPPCQVHQARPGEPDVHVLRGQYATLAAAMAAASHPSTGDWQVACPGQLVLAPHAGETGWMIEAPGIARRFAEACPADGRIWSPAATRITNAVLEVTCPARCWLWALPYPSALRVAGRLDALHATGGLTPGGIFAALAEACGRIGMVPPPAVADVITGRIAAGLAAAGVPVDGYQASEPASAPAATPALPGAPARPAPPGSRLRACLDTVFWRVIAPAETILAVPAGYGRLRAALRRLAAATILAGPPAAVIMVCGLRWFWPTWTVIVSAGGAIHPARQPRPEPNSRPAGSPR